MSTPAALVNHHDEIAVKTKTPLQKMCEAFPLAYQRRNGWWAHDDNPRFDWWESPEGNIRIHSWTGRTIENILSMGHIPLSRADLYAKPGIWSQVQSRDKLDLVDLAQYWKIDHLWLITEGFIDEYTYSYPNGSQVRCVKMGGYFTPDGKPHTKNQVRLSIHKEPRFLFDQDTPGEVIPCGLHYLGRARLAKYLFLVEGPGDWATMTFHGQPSIGIPGANHVKCLDVGLFADIDVIYITEEPDQAKKLQNKGQGFYKDMHAWLRKGGYKGAIFSIRFEEVTGYKDPSELHKAIYQECAETEEGPFREVVHTRFIEAIEQAREQAIPEGNGSLALRVQQRQWATIGYEEWSRLVMAVKPEYLSPIQKIILLYLFLYLRDVEPGEKGWKIDADTMAKEVGLKKKKFLEHLTHLTDKLGLFRKAHQAIKEYVEDSLEPRYKGTELFLRPTPALYQPRGYCVAVQEQHINGGPRQSTKADELPADQEDTCDNCGSHKLEPYAKICVDCEHVKYPPIEEDDPPSEQATTIESTATVQPLEEESQQSTEIPSLGYSVIESVRDTQFGVLGETAPAESDSAPSYPPPRPYPLCHSQEQAAWQWNPHINDGKGGWECAMCHPPAVEVQPIPKPKSKSVSWLTLPIAAVL